MSSHHSEQMSQRSQVSRIALCVSKVKVSDWLSQWVSDKVPYWAVLKVKVSGFKCIQVHSKQEKFWKKETIILYLNVSLNTILSPDIYVALEQELKKKKRNYVFWVDPSISDYSWLFWTCRASTISDLLINLRLSRKRVSPLVGGGIEHLTVYRY